MEKRVYYVDKICRARFGEELKKLLVKKGITQKDFSSRIGLSRTIVGEYINGISFPSVENLEKICKDLGVSKEYFFGNCSIQYLDDKKTREIFGKRLRMYKKACGLTQKRLAEMCNINVNYISRFLNYKALPNAYQLQNIADALNKKPEEFFIDFKEDNDENLGLRLHNLLKEKNITQRDLKKLTGLSTKTISKIVRGESQPGMDTLMCISNAINENIDSLIGVQYNLIGGYYTKDEENCFGKNLKKRLCQKRLTIDRFAKTIGITRSALTKYICGVSSPKVCNLKKIVVALEISADELLGNV